MKKILSIFIAFALIANLFAPVAYAVPELPQSPEEASEAQEPDSPEQPENVPPEEEEPEEEELVEEVAEPVEENLEVEEPEAPNTPGEEDGDENYTGNESGDNVVGGEVEIETGDAEGNGAVSNIGNTNSSVSPAANSGIGGVVIVNDGNGTESDNSASVVIGSDSETNQDNSADLDNSLRVDTDSGNNSASGNTNADSSIDTGEANSSGTIFNSVNTNVDGLVVSEFNVVDDHMGDYVLDYEAGCILGCQNFGGVDVGNIGNGSESDNEIDLDLMDTSTTFQNNDAGINNELILTANTGENTTNNNTGGSNSIETGDANVSGNVLNFANNNFAGNVVYGVVNVFGDLIGDIIIPESVLASLGYGGGVNAGNIGNGSGSTNVADLDVTAIDELNQFNNAEIVNNININANTGGNSASDNTGGDSKISTGDVNIDAQVINIANNNFAGGNWWIVIVNEAGNWVGKLIGLPGATVGGNYAMSGGGIDVAGNGDINIANQGNGADSTNTGSIGILSENTTTQNNNAVIVNDIDLSAVTGGNSASRNTNGDNSIETGDANVMLNLVNFVNNNFAGGNVFLTVVNVFGNFFGDIVTPGAQKEQIAQGNNGGVGGTSEPGGSDGDNNNDGGGGSESSSALENSGDVASGGTQVAAITSSTFWKGNGVLGEAGVNIEAHAAEGEIAEAVSDEGGRRLNLAYAALLVPAYLLFLVGKRTGASALLLGLLRRR